MSYQVEDDYRIKTDLKDFLCQEWIKAYFEIDRIWDLLVEDADVLTITFILQHLRTKVLKQIDNWEKDCATASHVLEKFSDRIKQNNINKLKRDEELKQYYKQLVEISKKSEEQYFEYEYKPKPCYTYGTEQKYSVKYHDEYTEHYEKKRDYLDQIFGRDGKINKGGNKT